MSKPRPSKFDYDVCLSFAGEDRTYVSRLADALRERGVRVFYDEYEKVALWGRDLYVHLNDVYDRLARYCVVFISKHYKRKLWTNHERQAAQERAFRDHADYILPARFDDTALPGLRDTVGYIDLRATKPVELAELIWQKLGPRQRGDFFPPSPDRLLNRLPFDGETDRDVILERAHSLFSSLRRTDAAERSIIFNTFMHGCPAELPENVHINMDLLRRLTGFTPIRIKRVAEGLESLGLMSRVRRNHGDTVRSRKQEYLEFRYECWQVDADGDATELAHAMIDVATEDCCEECGIKALMDLDFGQLASSTHEKDLHGKKRRG
ncbi:MAG TPA: TIR domain-containing protein [Clostridia bacterium]|nr:TIR domain-containing protein [Clostridia bacterium]